MLQGKPLLLAVQDFHAPASMTISRTALPIYLYGMEWEWHRDETGTLVIVPRKLDRHQWGTKVIASGFFNFAEAENISAVIANARATISKFNRMGVVTGFGSKRVRLIRRGTAANPDPNSAAPQVFVHTVNAPTIPKLGWKGLTSITTRMPRSR